MSAVVTPTPDGQHQVTCLACRTQAVTPFREVAQGWARTHVCSITTLRALRAARRRAETQTGGGDVA